MSRNNGPRTPDGRYFVSRGVLRRCTNPSLDDRTRRALIKELMQARHIAMRAVDDAEVQAARARIHEAKQSLGETGPVWWQDNAPDESGVHPSKSTYAIWWAELDEQERANGL